MKENILTTYIRESFEELNKVSWPTKNQAIRLTAIVLGFTLVAAAFIAAVDYLFQLGFAELLKQLKAN